MDHEDPFSYRWSPISDLPEHWQTLVSPELASFAPIWLEHKQTLQQSEDLRQFIDKMKREWSIETGIIENIYTLDRGITQTLINHGIQEEFIPRGMTDKPPSLLVRILKDHESVIDGLFDFIAHRRQLSVSYIREMHQALTRHQDTTEGIDQFGNKQEIPLLKGEWKKLPNNPTRPDGLIHEYCPPVHVASEMDRMVEMNLKHQDAQVPPEVEAAWLHHRFTQIHPFQDGNGRVARALTSMVLIQAGWFPLIVERDSRVKYINACEAADKGDLAPLVQLFSGQQLQSMRRAVSLASDVLEDRPAYQILIDSAIERLKAQLEQHQTQRLIAVSLLAKRLIEDAKGRFFGVAGEITRELKTISGKYFADVQQNTNDDAHWFKFQIVRVAQDYDYFADTNIYRAWIRLRIRWERQVEIVLSIHSIGTRFVGAFAVSAFLLYRNIDPENGSEVSEPHALAEDIFQFSYKDDYDLLTPRFRDWLDKVIIVALKHWREQL